MSSYESRRGSLNRRSPLLSVGERERLMRQMREDASYLSSFKGTPEGDAGEAHLAPSQSGRPVDEDAVRKRINRTKRALEALSPKRLAGAARQKAVKEMREHEAWLKKNMLSTYDMGAFPNPTDMSKDHNYRKAVDKSFKQEVGNPEYNRRAMRVKELARILEPDDPELSNLERLRPTHRY